MNNIKNKLRSKSGASMLIAMVFMLFCLFVGGVVLAAASANGYRVAHLSDQQDFLSQRSAGLLLSDMIDENLSAIGGEHYLAISDVKSVYTPITILEGGGQVVDTSRSTITEHTLTFTAKFSESNPMTPVQRVLYETAVCRYLEEKGLDPTNLSQGIASAVPVLKGFYYSDGSETKPFTLSDFWCQNTATREYTTSGKIDIHGITGVSNTVFTDYTADFNCGSDTRLYDFYVSFGSYTQLSVSANAYFSERNIGPVEGITNKSFNTVTHNADGSTTTGVSAGDWQVSTTTSKTTIRWEDSYIEKGGA